MGQANGLNLDPEREDVWEKDSPVYLCGRDAINRCQYLVRAIGVSGAAHELLDLGPLLLVSELQQLSMLLS